ncbi:MAG TPA: hypothetical protein VFR49_02325, partial [Solirubrobacteraceae bacterium]|nr:hypothetical protein [Solirubrobacteraceae bacterium]
DTRASPSTRLGTLAEFDRTSSESTPGAPPDHRHLQAAPIQPRRLAQATGGALAVDPAGRSTVVFRAADAPGPNPGAPRLDSSKRSPDWSPAAAATDHPAAFEDLYDRLLDRVRRDLTIERERAGGLTHHLF